MIEPNSSQIIDPRIVHTVRVLKENGQNQSQSQALKKQMSNGERTNEQHNHDKDKNKNKGEDQDDEVFKNDIESNKEIKKTNEHLSQNNLHRISIDGSVNKRRNTRELSEKIPNNSDFSESMNKVIIDSKIKNVHINNTNINTNNGRALLLPQKTKAHFIKNLMNDTSIKKYKSMCISILKEDPQITKLCIDCNMMNNANSLEYFINKNLFNNSLFLYKLEMLLSSDQVMNKNYKDKFFKRELIKVLNQLYLDIKYQQKMEMLEKTFEEHFQLISQFDFTNG